MRQLTAICAIVLFSAGICIAEEPDLKTQKDKISYVMGIVLAKDMLSQGVELNSDVFVRGLKDGLAGAKSALSDEDAKASLEVFNREMMAKKQAELAKAAVENRKQEETFMTENRKKAGVFTLPSGLQYRVITEGSGPKPTLYDTVTVNYRGTLVNGTEFDSSYKRNQPANFPVNGLIPGWTEALQMMKAGSKWQLFIPSRLAYGESGAGNLIPPNAPLVFDVELVGIKENGPQPKAAPAATGEAAAADK